MPLATHFPFSTLCGAQVLEYMEGGSLEQLMRDTNGPYTDRDSFQAIAHNVLKVGELLH